MENTEIIAPWLPENLDSLHKHEEELRIKSILEINADQNLKDQLIIVQESINMIYKFTKSFETKKAMELTIQYLGARLFNSIVTAIKLMLSGYYQSSVMFQRDVLEIGFLLDYFLSDKTKISHSKSYWPPGKVYCCPSRTGHLQLLVYFSLYYTLPVGPCPHHLRS